MRSPPVEGVKITVTLLDESGQPSADHEPVTTGPMDITLDPYVQDLEMHTGRPTALIDGLPEEAQTLADCGEDCTGLRLDLEALPPGEYTYSVDVLHASTARVIVERTPPTADVDVWGAWALTTVVLHGQQVSIPDDARFSMLVDGISMSGDIGCNAYFGTLTVDGEAVNARFVGQTAVGCDEDELAAGEAFVEAIGRVDHAARTVDRLVLSGRDARLVFDRRDLLDMTDVVDRDWELAAFLDADARTPVTAEQTTVRFNSDGTFRLRSGCMGTDGRWTARGDALFLPESRNANEPNCAGTPHRDRIHQVFSQTMDVHSTSDQLKLHRAATEQGMAFDPVD